MPYLFATEDRDYTDLSSGRVLYNLPGAPAFPVRLASEILQRARKILGTSRRLALFDPTCGGAYHLTSLGFLHGEWIGSITAADIDSQAITLAQRNLSLLTLDGIDRRIAEIELMLAQYGKLSHTDALRSAKNLRAVIAQQGQSIPTRTFQADVLDSEALRCRLGDQPVELVISDIPYGQLSTWRTPREENPAFPPLQRMLGTLLAVLKPGALVAIATDKRQKVAHPAFHRAGHFRIGKREVTFLAL